MKSNWEILVVDDEEVMRESLAAWLREDGYGAETASSGTEAIEMARQKDYAIYFVDLKMPGGVDGIATLLEIKRLHPTASVVIITAHATVDTAITAMKEGAQDYLVKPFSPAEISLLVEKIVKVKNLERENIILRKKLTRQYNFHDLLSKNAKMHEIFALIREVASVRSTVLIQGESGTGKELIARAIHHESHRHGKAFVGVSCAALTETLLESELFGHEKGAFTGAVGQKRGKFELARGGTIFLDEIGDITPRLQVDLLRVLQERSFYRVGGSEEVKVDVRVIAATNRDLQEAVAAGWFREDLYYRLNVINIHLPPLRERREDIPLLARNFVQRLALELPRDVTDLTEDAIRVLMDHDWPGNVRELENAVERAIVSCRERVLGAEDFAFLQTNPARHGWAAPSDQTLDEVEKQVIASTLLRTRGNIKEAALSLGIDRSTLYDRIRKYKIERPTN